MKMLQFLEMCILSGCDYLPSIPGFGLKKAYLAIKQHGNYTKVRSQCLFPKLFHIRLTEMMPIDADHPRAPS